LKTENEGRWPKEMETEDPWNVPSEWYLYRCRSCDSTSWTEDIVFDAFPHHKPDGGPALGCTECNALCYWDSSIPTKFSIDDPSLPPR
jgi:hypothetical protein